MERGHGPTGAPPVVIEPGPIARVGPGDISAHDHFAGPSLIPPRPPICSSGAERLAGSPPSASGRSRPHSTLTTL
ncbi:hypothetical protein G3I77_14815 [Streptomyces sp. D2-8]|uniref:hypothetical protein n=1 Tax=Streptomyces sp. D2-8 TaxID=2707767 RepID=UPI0020BE40E1|nr:hypothetical protein [Streptomyces sp. D2-8]MCK8434250.1 hypothetical protein [Streptomyces sp. D2-8]